jgi:hypothetical protein
MTANDVPPDSGDIRTEDIGAPGTWQIVFKSGAVVTLDNAQLERSYAGNVSHWEFKRGADYIALGPHRPNSSERPFLDEVIDLLVKLK